MRAPGFPALWLLALLGFAVMAGFAAARDTFPADLWLAHRLQDVHSGAFNAALDLPETLADLPYVLAVWLPALALLLLARQPVRAFLFLVAPLGWPANSALKLIIDRPRPSAALVRVADAPSGSGFPSGHAITAFLVFGLLLYLATVLVRPLWARLLLQLACLYGIVFTGLARVYHGAHWPSDVLGAFYLGALFLALLIAADRILQPPPARVTNRPPLRF
ncbi:MAG TPA: phosphatase PAP2 family protein [Dehalococcoidia bacterium]|nr:phosphatase PAP2 family protein [Dehalococcoidia bacterium]